MIDSELNSFFLFAAGMFAVLNGPLWFSVRARVFAGHRQAPPWLHRGVSWFSRLLGIAMLVAWTWVSTGALKPALLLGLIVAIGLFCLLDGPWRIITRAGLLRHGPQAPSWMEGIAVWLPRLGGAVVLLSGLATGIWFVTG
jgi:hypothetical protein